MDFIIDPAPQGSQEWRDARTAHFTASVAGDMLARTKTGPAASRRNLCVKLALERLIGRSLDAPFVSQAMATGTEREPLARAAYEAVIGDLVTECGVLTKPSIPWVGASLDGYVGDFERLISIKCRQPAAHWDFLCTGTVPADALAQIRHELWLVPQAKGTDYVCWNPDFPPTLQLRIVTMHRADADIPGYAEAAAAFLAEVEIEYQALRTMAEGITERTIP